MKIKEWAKSKKRITLPVAVIVIAVLMFPMFSYSATALPVAPTGQWFTFAFIGILSIFTIAAIVYMLSGLVGSNNARSWSRMQMYEALLSGILIVIFIAVSALFLTNPIPSFGGSGSALVPSQCGSATDLYTLASCDLAQFNNDAYSLFGALFLAATVAGLSSGFSIEFSPTRQNSNIDTGFGFTLTSIFPFAGENLVGFMFDALLLTLLLTQVMLIIISGSLLWLAFFLTLGLIARSFGFTRTFGGAMIAIGLGLGFIFPLMTSITYGFLSNQIGVVNPNGLALSLFSAFFEAIFTQQVCSGGCTWLPQLALIGAGLTFIPFLNFTIVDAFIVDFSKAIGERMDFMSMLTSIV